MNEKPYKRILTVFLAVLMLLCLGGRKEVHAQDREDVEDFDGLIRNVYEMLCDDGVFIFLQENPLRTCHSGGDRWTRDENGNKLYLNLKDYGVEGERESEWFVDNVKKYHRTFSTIVNTLIAAGFSMEKMMEPLPTPELLEKYPDYNDLFHKPDFLIMRVISSKESILLGA